MTLREDNPIRKMMIGLQACLIEQLEDEENGVPRPCRIMWIPGEAATPEYQGPCDDSPHEHDCGFAWVRVMNITQVSAPGVPAQDNGLCSNSRLGLDINMGITRCWEMANDPKYTPSPAVVEERVTLLTTDALIMRKTIRCCPTLAQNDLNMGGYTPLGPGGGLVGGSWSFSVML